ncbi:unnamed protein product [Rotaria sordida]|uniref:Uncharacterized protein n=1 Tax=Rotaria sordida TaxID=392033 RepID=A0A814SQD9_9BILA|nr:unnamed protein product [Rotaria sordida]
MIKSFAVFLLIVCVFATLTVISEACGGHDSACVGTNGHQGSCCRGMHCQKNDPTWAYGRCYYNPGKK